MKLQDAGRIFMRAVYYPRTQYASMSATRSEAPMTKTASVKLTDAIREKICRAMLAHRFGNEAQSICMQYHQLAHSLYLRLYAPKVRAQMDALPEGWLPTERTFPVQLGGEYWEADLRFDAVGGRRRSGLELPGFNRHRFLDRDARQSRVLLQLEAADAFAIEYERIRAIECDFCERRADAERQIEAALSAVSSTGRLREFWPEAMPFVDRCIPTVVRLPAPPVASLNAMLGLGAPPAADEAESA
jgi:hypothetical protein